MPAYPGYTAKPLATPGFGTLSKPKGILPGSEPSVAGGLRTEPATGATPPWKPVGLPTAGGALPGIPQIPTPAGPTSTSSVPGGWNGEWTGKTNGNPPLQAQTVGNAPGRGTPMEEFQRGFGGMGGGFGGPSGGPQSMGQFGGFRPPPTMIADWQQNAAKYGQPTMGQRIGTDIAPAPLYDDQSTDMAANAQLREGLIRGNRSPTGAAMEGFSSSSPATQLGDAVGRSQAIGQGMQNAEGVRMSDALANAQHSLAGQKARFADVLGQAGANQGLNAMQTQRAGRQQGSLLDAIMSMSRGTYGDEMGNIQDRLWRAQMNVGNQRINQNTMLDAFGMGNRLNEMTQYDGGGGGLLESLLWGL